jgi:hypothetical protein
MRTCLLALAFFVLASALPSLAWGQAPPRNRVTAQSIRNDAIYGRPTVSPYLNLLRPQGGVGAPNYQSLVRPQLDQERLNQRQGQQLQQLQSRIYQGPSSQASSGTPMAIRSTGHTTQYMNYSAYYPALGQRR